MEDDGPSMGHISVLVGTEMLASWPTHRRVGQKVNYTNVKLVPVPDARYLEKNGVELRCKDSSKQGGTLWRGFVCFSSHIQGSEVVATKDPFPQAACLSRPARCTALRLDALICPLHTPENEQDSDFHFLLRRGSPRSPPAGDTSHLGDGVPVRSG